MKKIITILSVFVLLTLSVHVFAQQEANIYIPILKTDKLEYSRGETIQVEFRIDNSSNLRQSDVHITTSLVSKVNDKNVELNIVKHQEGLYLEASSQRTILIEHVVDAQIQGPTEFVVSAFLKDGSLVGQKRNPISIINTNPKEIVTFDEGYILVDEEQFPLQAGPTVSKDAVVKIGFKTDSVSKNTFVKPEIKLFERTRFNNTAIKTLTLPDTMFSSGEEYSFTLPTDLTPQVYEGVLSFESSDLIIPPLYFRYIVEGPIGTIINVNTDKLSVKKDETVSVRIEYAGTPVPIENISEEAVTTPEIDDFAYKFPEDIDVASLSTEEFIQLLNKLRTEQSEDIVDEESKKEALIKTSLMNEKGEIIGTATTAINLNESGNISLDIVSTKNAKKFSVVTEMLLEDGTILSTYKTYFPSEKELKDAYKTSWDQSSWIVWGLSTLLLVIVLIGVILIRKKLHKYALMLTIPLLITLGSFAYMFSDLEASLTTFSTSQVFSAYGYPLDASKLNYLKVNSIFSPLPATSRSYAPGEPFQLNINASYVACNNNGFTNILYGPATNWWSPRWINAYNQVYWGTEWQSYYSTIKVGPKHRQDIYFPLGGDTHGPMVLSRLVELWTTTEGQVISGIPRWSNSLGWVSNGIQGMGGRELWRGTGWGDSLTHVGGHEQTSQYNINTAHTYNMPTQPGKHRFYFMLQNWAQGNTTSFRVVSQEVCVRGAMVCPDEVEPPLCSNLTGVFTRNALDQIVRDGIVTTLVQDTSGLCVEPTTTCPDTRPEDRCIDGFINTAQCNLVNGVYTWQMIPTTTDCPPLDDVCSDIDGIQTTPPDGHISDPNGTCPLGGDTTLSISCAPDSNTLTIAKDSSSTGPVTFKATVSNGTAPYTYTWYDPFTNSSPSQIQTSSSKTNSYFLSSISNPGNTKEFRKELKVKVTDAAGNTKEILQNCFVVITDENKGGPLGTEPTIESFSFSPSIGDSINNKCPLILKATNVTECKLTRNGVNLFTVSTTSPNIIDINSTNKLLYKYVIGTYRVSCTGTDGTTKAYPDSRTCSPNPRFGEF